MMPNNMKNNNPQEIYQQHMPPNSSQPKVHINIVPQSLDSSQVVPIHINPPNHNHTQTYIGN